MAVYGIAFRSCINFSYQSRSYMHVMHLSILSRWGGEAGHRRGIWRYKSACGRDFWSFVEFFWPKIMLLEWGICTFLIQDDFPRARHLNRKTDLSSNPPSIPSLPPQQLNIELKCRISGPAICISLNKNSTPTHVNGWAGYSAIAPIGAELTRTCTL